MSIKTQYQDLRKTGWRTFANYKTVMWKYHRLLRKATIKKRAVVHPVKLTLEVSAECNARCPFCVRVTGTVKRKKRLEPEHILRLIDEVPFYNMTPYGYGEPMIEPVEDYILAATQRGKRTGLTTNASLLTPRRADDLMKAGLDYMVLSLDAADRDTYESIRRGLSWGKTSLNVMGLRSIRKENAYKTHLTASIVICDQNRDRIEQIVDFWRPYLDTILVKEPWRLKPVMGPPDFVCPYPFIDMRVAVNGDLSFCCRDASVEMDLGNIIDGMEDGQTPMEVFNSERMQEIRTKMLKGQNPSVCNECDLWNVVDTRKEYR
jgi:sulfatase maturation enzyme AslB (radical SAM superfamily)